MIPFNGQISVTAVRETTGTPVTIGSEVTNHQGEVGTLFAITSQATPGRSGKVTVTMPDGSMRYTYDKVWGLAIVTVLKCGCTLRFDRDCVHLVAGDPSSLIMNGR